MKVKIEFNVYSPTRLYLNIDSVLFKTKDGKEHYWIVPENFETLFWDKIERDFSDKNGYNGELFSISIDLKDSLFIDEDDDLGALDTEELSGYDYGRLVRIFRNISEITSIFCCREVNPDNNVRLTNFTISFGRKVFNNLENTLKLTKWYIDPSDLN